MEEQKAEEQKIEELKEESKKEEKSNKEKDTLMAVLSYLGILVLIPFLTGAKKDPFVKFHMKQGIVLVICFIVNIFISMIPVLGWIAGFIIWWILIILMIIGVINVVQGKEKELPIIGKYAEKVNI